MKTGQHTIIPENENQCVWMDAGLVNYKLCEKNFDCESCPFDLIMKQQFHPFSERAVMQSDTSVSNFAEADIVERLMLPLTSASLPDDRLYFSNHSWLKKMDDGFCKIGIDSLLAGLLYPLVGAVVVNKSSRIVNDSPFAWLIRDNETFTLRTPVPGIVMTTNTSLTAKPSVITNDCYEKGWIVTVAPQENSMSASPCYTAEDFQSKLEHDIQRIETQLRLSLKKQSSSVGSTMYDGGTHVETIEQFIGEKRYTQLLSRLIHLQ
jgi:glycine cleavage system H lipoate-binding protein